jgi:hypothetical protein
MQVRTSLVRAASVGVALLTVAVLVPTAAQAASYTHRDATHDVQRFDFSTDAFSRADHNKRADITTATFTYTRHTLTTVLHLRSGSIGDQWAYGGRIRTSTGRELVVNIQIPPTEKLVELETRHGDRLSCDGLTRHAARSKGRLTVTVPSSCLGHPRWVRAGAAYGYTVNDNHQFGDDALQKRRLTADSRYGLSPRLRLKAS